MESSTENTPLTKSPAEQLRELFTLSQPNPDQTHTITVPYREFMALRTIIRKRIDHDPIAGVLCPIMGQILEELKADYDSSELQEQTVEMTFSHEQYEYIRERLFSPKFFRYTARGIADRVHDKLKKNTGPLDLTVDEYEFLRTMLEKQMATLEYNNRYYAQKRKPARAKAGSD